MMVAMMIMMVMMAKMTKTSIELRMLSSVTLNWHITIFVMNSGLHCQNCNPKCQKYLGLYTYNIDTWDT